MEGISKDELIRLQSSIFARDDEECANVKLRMLTIIIDQCRELQEPWIPLDEFLKSGFEGKCWVLKIDQEVQFTECYESITEQKVFSGNTGSIPHSRIIKVFPIHKPEPPR